MTHPLEMRRPLPSFDKWLEDNGDGTRGDGFEAFADLAIRTQDQSALGLPYEAALLLRMWQGFQIATVEICNIQCRDFGATPEQIIQMMPRALACAAMYSTASVLVEDTPWRTIAKVLTEEFRFAAKEAADQMTEGGK